MDRFWTTGARFAPILLMAATTSCVLTRPTPSGQPGNGQPGGVVGPATRPSAESTVEPPPAPARPEKSVDTCKLLRTMEACWSKANTLLGQINSCGEFGASYGDGVREELESRGYANGAMTAEAASFSCAGLCAMKRYERDLTWPQACRTAATAMKCDSDVCPPGE